MTKHTNSYPTPEQLYAFEVQARRMRAQALAQALRAGASAVKSLYARVASAIGDKVVRHA